MEDLTAFQRDILFVVAGREGPHGLEIKEALEDYYDREINHGRLYPNLDDLAAKGFLKKGQKDKRTNWYALSEQGVNALKYRRAWEDQLDTHLF